MPVIEPDEPLEAKTEKVSFFFHCIVAANEKTTAKAKKNASKNLVSLKLAHPH